MKNLDRPQYREVIVWKGWFHTEHGDMYGALIKRIRIA